LPPFCFIALALIGLVVSYRRLRLGRRLIAGSLIALWIVSTTAFNGVFLDAMKWPPVSDLTPTSGAQAIVVLGGGASIKPPEYGGKDVVNARTLNRLRYAAWLQKQTGLPILAAGGRTQLENPIESELMRSALENELGASVRWTEAESRNTYENARFSAAILSSNGIKRFYLVTESSHMRRAMEAFEPTGADPIPAPIEIFDEPNPLTIGSFLPSVTGFSVSYRITHELLGRLWYAIRARLPGA